MKFAVILAFLCIIVSPTVAQAEISAHFECKWWSEDQMENLDPDHPPSKDTTVRLQKWEYSDPIGVPHPDTVSLIVEIPTEQTGNIVIQTYWRKEEQWIKGTRIITPKIDTFNKTKRNLVFDIPVAKDVEQIYPDELKAEIELDDKKISSAALPFIMGD